MSALQQLWDQPKGLLTLCFTELWERFGYYFLQVIFVLFLTKAAAFSQSNADLLYGAFSALLFVTPTIGGWLADHYLGFRRAIIFGGVLLLMGYALMMFSEMRYFYIGIGFLIVGNGLFKPNVSSIVGDLYATDDAGREGGFTLFYMGINIGSLIPPVIATSVIMHWGWHVGFALASVGMLVSLFTFTLCSKVIWHIGQAPKNSPLTKKDAMRVIFFIKFLVGILIALALFTYALYYPAQTGKIVIAAAILFIALVFFYLFRVNQLYRRKMLAALALIVLSIVFWTLYSEGFTALMFFADTNSSHHLMGFTITPERTQFYNGFFIIVLAPLFNFFWGYLDRHHLNPSVPLKFALGIAFMCLGYVFLTWGTNGHFGIGGVISGWWLVGSYFLQTVGELLLSPIGLSMITVLAPKHLVGMMMGVWFFALAAASSLSGFLATTAAMPKNVSPVVGLTIFHHAFGMWSWMSAVATLVAFACYPFLKWMITDPGAAGTASGQ